MTRYLLRIYLQTLLTLCKLIMNGFREVDTLKDKLINHHNFFALNFWINNFLGFELNVSLKGFN